MVHSVRLDHWPEGACIPEEFREKLWHDRSRGLLCHDGFMSKTEFDRLLEVSRDWPYRRALDELFRLCVPETAEPKKSVWWLPFSRFRLSTR